MVLDYKYFVTTKRNKLMKSLYSFIINKWENLVFNIYSLVFANKTLG